MSKRFANGLVVGKFCPLHRGHEMVIHRAIRECDRVFILGYSNPEFPGCEAERRERWLAQLFPNTERLVLTGERLSIAGKCLAAATRNSISSRFVDTTGRSCALRISPSSRTAHDAPTHFVISNTRGICAS